MAIDESKSVDLHVGLDYDLNAGGSSDPCTLTVQLIAQDQMIAEQQVASISDGSEKVDHFDWNLSALNLTRAQLDDLKVNIKLAGATGTTTVLVSHFATRLTYTPGSDLSDQTNNRLRNTKERDASIGLDNDGFRYYDPTTATYIQRDPSGYGDGLNVYTSVHDDPVNGCDPTGLWTVKGAFQSVGSGIARAGNAVGSAASATYTTVADATGLHGSAVASGFWGGAKQGTYAGYTNVSSKAWTAAAVVEQSTVGAGHITQWAGEVRANRNAAWDAAELSGTATETASDAFAWGGWGAIGAAALLESGSAAGLTQLGNASSIGELITTAKLEAATIALTGGTGALYGSSGASPEGEVASMRAGVGIDENGIPFNNEPDVAADARAARDALAAQGGTSHAAYSSAVGADGNVYAASSGPPGVCAENNVAAQAGDNAQFQNTFGFRGGEYQQIPVCTECQQKYSRDQFPPDVQFDADGAWSEDN